jgi:hypothetical protein
MNNTFREQTTSRLHPIPRYFPGSRLRMLLVLVFGLAGGIAHAQNAGSVFGTVVDASGAVLPAATATLTEQDRGFTRKVTTNSSGAYLFPDIPVGTYTLTVAAPKFRTSVDQGVIVDANQNVKMDIKLSIGSPAPM